MQFPVIKYLNVHVAFFVFLLKKMVVFLICLTVVARSIQNNKYNCNYYISSVNKIQVFLHQSTLSL